MVLVLSIDIIWRIDHYQVKTRGSYGQMWKVLMQCLTQQMCFGAPLNCDDLVF